MSSQVNLKLLNSNNDPVIRFMTGTNDTDNKFMVGLDRDGNTDGQFVISKTNGTDLSSSSDQIMIIDYTDKKSTFTGALSVGEASTMAGGLTAENVNVSSG